MKELFTGVDLDEKIEVNVAIPEGLKTDEVQKGEQGKTPEAIGKIPEAKEIEDTSDLMEVSDGPEQSSLNTEKKPKEKSTEKKVTLEEEVKDFKEKGSEDSKISKETKTPESKEPDDSSSSSPFVAFAKVLTDEGVLSSFDQKKIEEEGVQGLINSVVEEIQAEVEAYKESLPEQIKEILNNYEEGVPLDKMINVKSKQIELDGITDTKLEADENLQKEIVKQELLTRGFDQKEVDDMITDYVDLGKLEAKSKTALGKLKISYKEAQENMKKEVKEYQETLQKQRVEQLKQIKDTIDKTEEIIPTMKMTKSDKEKLYKSLTTVVQTDQEGKPMNAVMAVRAQNPLEFEKRLHYFTMLGFFNEKADFGKLMVTAKTNATKELEQVLNTGERFKGTGKAADYSNKLNTGLLESLSQFKSDK
jgi:hypothetical protein